MGGDRHAGLVGGGRVAQEEIAVVHRQRQRAAGLELAADEIVDIGHHRPQRIDRQMDIGEALVAGAVSGEKRLVQLEQHHRSRPHGELAAAMDHLRRKISGIAREAKTVVAGLDHLVLLPPHRDEAASSARAWWCRCGSSSSWRETARRMPDPARRCLRNARTIRRSE
ncbi:hypothetical protein ACVME8_002894 [Bradyrhizobium diazoefficiens]